MKTFSSGVTHPFANPSLRVKVGGALLIGSANRCGSFKSAGKDLVFIAPERHMRRWERGHPTPGLAL